MANLATNHHFVPVSYIDRFTESGKISVFFKQNGKLETNQNPRNYAAERLYNLVSLPEIKQLMEEIANNNSKLKSEINYNDPLLIEKYFCRTEGDAKVLFDRIEQDPTIIDSDESIIKTVIFLHDLAYRNHTYRDDIAKLNAETYKVISKINLPDKEQVFVEKTFGPEQARSQQLHAITSTTPVLQTSLKLLEEYDIFFATAEKDARFLISDDPAYAVRLDFQEFCFPLSGKHALLFRKPDFTAPIMGTDIPVGKRINISFPNVVRYNLLQFCFASRYVFGDELNLRRVKLLLEQTQKMNTLRTQ